MTSLLGGSKVRWTKALADQADRPLFCLRSSNWCSSRRSDAQKSIDGSWTLRWGKWASSDQGLGADGIKVDSQSLRIWEFVVAFVLVCSGLRICWFVLVCSSYWCYWFVNRWAFKQYHLQFLQVIGGSWLVPWKTVGRLQRWRSPRRWAQRRWFGYRRTGALLTAPTPKGL